MPFAFSLTGEGLCCGWDSGEPVTSDYEAPFRFTGTIKRVSVDVRGTAHRDLETEVDMALARR